MDEKNKNESFSDSYYKARKWLCLYSGILLAWELIGITPTQKPFSGFDITLKSPEAAPFVLVTLIFYFTLRYWIEWSLLDEGFKRTLNAKVDALITALIAIIALLIWVLQKTYESQIFDNELALGAVGITLGSLGGIMMSDEIRRCIEGSRKKEIQIFSLLASVTLILLFSLIIVKAFTSETPKAFSTLAPFGWVTGIGTYILLRLLRKSLSAKELVYKNDYK